MAKTPGKTETKAKPRARKRVATANVTGSKPAMTQPKPVAAAAEPAVTFAPVLCFVGDASPKLWGMSARDRSVKLFSREGLTDVVSLDDARRHTGPVILIRSDAVFDGPLVPAILKRPNFVLLGSEGHDKDVIAANVRAADIDAVLDFFGGRVAADGSRFVTRTPSELQVSFKKSLVKREVPFALRLTSANAKDVEWQMFMSTYKGATDLVTKHVWPVPAFHVTRYLAARGVTPNAVTTVGAASMLVAFYLFLTGLYWPGLLFAWFMTFLDTVDGKLARTTLTSSYWGDIFDHGIDLVHPPFWYMAWIFGLGTWNIVWTQEQIVWVLSLIFGGYILQRIMEGIAIKWLGLVIHIWRPIDTLFRKVTARRNPNLLILTLSMLVMRPEWGIAAVAAWTVICLALHGIQLVQALAEVSRAGAPLKSWMDQP